MLVTHDLDECYEVGEYICLLENGKMVQAGNKEAVLAKTGDHGSGPLAWYL